VERIWIRGLTLFGHHGVYPEERKQGQCFLVDARIDIERSLERDELSETVDYTAVIDALREQNESQSFRLLESLAEALVRALMERFDTIRRVQLRVRKRMPGLTWVAAEVVRTREGSPAGG
jgi:dihydroneopterin aldolase